VKKSTLLWTMVVVLHNQCPIVLDDGVVQQILLFLKSAMKHLMEIDVLAEQDLINSIAQEDNLGNPFIYSF
jgi:hypothetical protein